MLIDFKTGRVLPAGPAPAPAPAPAPRAFTPSPRKRGTVSFDRSALVTDAKRSESASPSRLAPNALPRVPAGGHEERRKTMLAKVHVAKKQLGLTEEEYRGMLSGNFGVDSAKFLTAGQLDELLGLLAGVGFKATRGRAPRKADRKKAVPPLLDQPELNAGTDALMGKIEALLAEKGRMEGTHVPWNYAVAILKRQSGGVTRCFEHASAEQLRGVIAALTRDAKRNGRYYEVWGEARNRTAREE